MGDQQYNVPDDESYLFGQEEVNGVPGTGVDETPGNADEDYDPFSGVDVTPDDGGEGENNNNDDHNPFVGIDMSLDEAEQSLKQPSPMTSVVHPPASYTNNPAQVIAVTTSLKGMVHAYFSSTRMKHFLNCKRIKWIDIDTNKDFITGRGLRNSELIDIWNSSGVLLLDSDGRPELPQCIIDGVSVGDVTAVFELEEDGNFDHIFNRSICPICLGPREPPEDNEYEIRTICEECGRELGPIIPPDIYYSSDIEHIFSHMTDEPDKTPAPPGTVIPYEPDFRLFGGSSKTGRESLQ